jgi:flavin reductase (DIM6/NTAB) family NADH-FMN oxidoreductase RutF
VSTQQTEVDRQELFRDAMRGLCSGISVVTVCAPDGTPAGLVATSVSSFSDNPPSIVASIAHDTRSHEAIASCRYFGVHMLAADQEDIARTFAQPIEEKFDAAEWDWDGSVPRIAGALSYLHCRRSRLFDLYDHSLVVGDVTSGFASQGEPLVYLARCMDWRLERRDDDDPPAG